MASVLPSGANTFRSVSSWGLASPRSILVMNALDAGAAGAASSLFSWVMVDRALRCARPQRSFLLMENQSSAVDASLSMRPAS